jgi:hypothetical protein
MATYSIHAWGCAECCAPSRRRGRRSSRRSRVGRSLGLCPRLCTPAGGVAPTPAGTRPSEGFCFGWRRADDEVNLTPILLVSNTVELLRPCDAAVAPAVRGSPATGRTKRAQRFAVASEVPTKAITYAVLAAIGGLASCLASVLDQPTGSVAMITDWVPLNMRCGELEPRERFCTRCHDLPTRLRNRSASTIPRRRACLDRTRRGASPVSTLPGAAGFCGGSVRLNRSAVPAQGISN